MACMSAEHLCCILHHFIETLILQQIRHSSVLMHCLEAAGCTFLPHLVGGKSARAILDAYAIERVTFEPRNVPTTAASRRITKAPKPVLGTPEGKTKLAAM